MKIDIVGVKQVLCIKHCVLQSVMLLFGVVMVYLAVNYISHISAYYYLLFTIGIILISAAVVGFIWKRKVYIVASSKSPILHATLNVNVPNTQSGQLISALQKGEEQFLKHHKDESANNMVVDIVYSQDGTFGAFRVSEYKGYNFEETYPWEVVQNYSMKSLSLQLKL